MKARLLAIAIGLTATGCHRDAGSPATIDPEVAPEPEVRIDLAPQGMSAWIAAPEGAEASVGPRGVELRGGGGDFHLLLRRGSLDPLAEKTHIVKEYGSEFRRFVRDLGHEVVYETMVMGEVRHHFFFTAEDARIEYHCRTPEEGVPTLEAVEHMIEACQEVRFKEEIDAAQEPRELAADR